MGQDKNQDYQESSVVVESPTKVIAQVQIGPFMLPRPKPALPRPTPKR